MVEQVGEALVLGYARIPGPVGIVVVASRPVIGLLVGNDGIDPERFHRVPMRLAGRAVVHRAITAVGRIVVVEDVGVGPVLCRIALSAETVAGEMAILVDHPRFEGITRRPQHLCATGKVGLVAGLVVDARYHGAASVTEIGVEAVAALDLAGDTHGQRLRQRHAHRSLQLAQRIVADAELGIAGDVVQVRTGGFDEDRATRGVLARIGALRTTQDLHALEVEEGIAESQFTGDVCAVLVDRDADRLVRSGFGNTDTANVDELGQAVVDEAERGNFRRQVLQVVDAAFTQRVARQGDDRDWRVLDVFGAAFRRHVDRALIPACSVLAFLCPCGSRHKGKRRGANQNSLHDDPPKVSTFRGRQIQPARLPSKDTVSTITYVIVCPPSFAVADLPLLADQQPHLLFLQAAENLS